jgi:hypothetical protein
MEAITKNTKGLALDILTEAFEENPNLNWLIRKGGSRKENIRIICAHCLDLAMLKKGAYISNNGQGVALVYKSTAVAPLLPALPVHVRLAIRGIGLSRVPLVALRRWEVSKLRPKEEHLYVQMLAVSKSSRSMAAAIDLRDGIYALSKELNLPLYAETSLEQNKKVFERYGFHQYQVFQPQKAGFTLWFLKKP